MKILMMTVVLGTVTLALMIAVVTVIGLAAAMAVKSIGAGLRATESTGPNTIGG